MVVFALLLICIQLWLFLWLQPKSDTFKACELRRLKELPIASLLSSPTSILSYIDPACLSESVFFEIYEAL